jgi:hypothetical protein
MDLLAREGQWWPIAALCAVAIDVFADSTTPDGDAESDDYIWFIKNDDAFADYAEFAERFYHSFRCGLLHRMVTRDKRDGRDDNAEGRVALGDGHDKPRLKGDYLVIDVPHLMAAVQKSFSDFRANGPQPRRQNFTKRMRQRVFDETPEGLTPKS